MIESLSRRASFERLSREGRRHQGAIVWVRYAPDHTGVGTQVGYAIGKSVGTAVVRNRVRRRLRSILDSVARRDGLDAGLYLWGVRSGAAAQEDFSNLESDVHRLLKKTKEMYQESV